MSVHHFKTADVDSAEFDIVQISNRSILGIKYVDSVVASRDHHWIKRMEHDVSCSLRLATDHRGCIRQIRMEAGVDLSHLVT